jgi:hypothetical protein
MNDPLSKLASAQRSMAAAERAAAIAKRHMNAAESDLEYVQWKEAFERAERDKEAARRAASRASIHAPSPEELEDGDPMPWGKHAGTPLQDVPASYFNWLWRVEPDREMRVLSDPVFAYIKRNLPALRREFQGEW